MAYNDWADGDDLANISRGGNTPLADAGYDVDELVADPMKRQEALAAVTGPGSRMGLTRGGTNYQSDMARTYQNSPPQAATMPSAVSPDASRSGMSSASSTPGQAPPSTLAVPGLGGSNDVRATGAEALRRGLDLGNLAADTAKTLTTSTGPDVSDLEADRAAHAMPTPYRDPQTGKVLPGAQQYAPTGWQRFGRGVKSAVIGLATGGIPGAIVGAVEPEAIRGGTAYGAPNRAYQAAEQTRQATEGSDDAQIQQKIADFKALTERLSKGGAEARAGATAYNDTAKGATEMMNADTKGVEETNKANTARDQSPEGIAAAETARQQADWNELNRRADLIWGPGRGGSQRQLWLENSGKIPAREVVPGAGTGTPSVGTPGLSGEAYLHTLDPGMASTVRAIGEGREAPPGASNRSKQAQALLQAINQAYPGYDATAYPTYAATRREFTSPALKPGVDSALVIVSSTAPVNCFTQPVASLPTNSGPRLKSRS